MRKSKIVAILTIAVLVITLFMGNILPASTVKAQSVVSVQDACAGKGNGKNGRFVASVEANETGAIPISSVSELKKIGVQDGYSLKGNYYLTTNLDLSGMEWTPIGTNENHFTGTFDGQGYIISGLTMTGKTDCAGLFGYVGGMQQKGSSMCYTTPIFKNLGLENVNINVTNDSFGINVGGLFGNNHRGEVSVSNCYVTGEIKARSKSVVIGGIAGITAGYNPCGKMIITDSYNCANVTATSTTYEGFLEGVVIESGSACAGGLVGYGEDLYSVTNCHNFGSIISDSTGSAIAGGVVGFGFVYEVDQVSLCSNSGDIQAISSDGINTTEEHINYAYAGGILGYDSPNERTTTITSCYNKGDVLAKLTTSNPDVAVFAGGIGGRLNNQTITDCYNRGDIDAHNYDNTNGYAAGISGRVSAKSNVRRCYNTGTIAGGKKGAIAGYSKDGCSMKSNYYQLDSAEKGVAEGFGEEGTSEGTLNQMKLEETFGGFNFSRTWGFKAGENDNMPILQQMYPGFSYTSKGEVPEPEYEFLGEIEQIKEGSYPIQSVEELQSIGKAGGLSLTWDYYLTKNLDMSGVSWEPIDGFRGVFDGQGHSIYNLEIVGGYKNAGLFGVISSDYYNTHRPEIKNLALENVYINIVGQSASTCCVGALLGNNDRAYVNISNCYVTGEISNTSYETYTGGLVGKNGSSSQGMFGISDCENYASVTTNGNGATGGVIGAGNYVENMDSCHNFGRIRMDSDATYCVAGGLIGNLYDSNTINQCVNEGDITVEATASRYINAGGIIGFTNTNVKGVSLTNSYNTGEITALLDTDTSNTAGELNAGGISGCSIGLNIADCFNTGNIKAMHNWNSVGSAGGITGLLKNGSIRRSFSDGTISASEYVGGVVGITREHGFTNHSYWNKEADITRNYVILDSGIKKGIGSGDDATTGVTVEQLKKEETFSGFNFKKIWAFQRNVNMDYPVLRALNPSLSYTSTVEPVAPKRNFIVTDYELPKEGSIPIATREELEGIANDLTGSYHLVADIDLTGIDWKPIGGEVSSNATSRFTGTLDGQGHVITGLEVISIEKNSVERYSGLFGRVDANADIRNLGLEETYILNFSSTPRAGGFIGYGTSSDNVAIDNCYITGAVSSANGGNVGGIAGYLAGSSTYITNCYNLAKITSYSSNTVVGGIVGFLGYGKISGCYNMSDVSIFPDNSDSSAGGITGSISNGAEIVQSYNKGNITMDTKYDGYAGGISGCLYRNDCTVSECYNMGTVLGTTSNTSNTMKVGAGGIAGKNVGTINDCFNRANVTAGSAGESPIEINAGGIAGISYAKSIIAKCYNGGDVKSCTNIGGIAGFVETNATVSECYWNKEANFTIGTIKLGESGKKGICSGMGSTVGLSTSNMKLQENFEEFDFQEVWDISADINDGYPMLQTKKCLFTVSVLSGSGSSNTSVITECWAKGETTSITAPAAAATYRFKEWVSTDVTFEDKDSAQTSFTMPARNISITAIYEKLPSYNLEVESGVNSKGDVVQEGTKVTIYSNVPAGKIFKEWSADDATVEFEDKTARTTTFIMPGNDVKITPVFEDIIYTISVTNGKASSDTGIAGQLITIRADEPEAGKQFYRWDTVRGITYTDSSSQETTFIMPAADVSIEASYQNIVKGSQTAPVRPSLASKTTTSVTLCIIEGAEYCCNSADWQDSPVFSGLTSDTSYSFCARMKETDTKNASYSSSRLYIRTDEEKTSSSSEPTVEAGDTSQVNENPSTEDRVQDTNASQVTTSKRKAAELPVIMKQPKSIKLKRKAKHSLSVTAGVTTGTLSYQWQMSKKKKKGFKNIAGTASKKRTYKVTTKKKGTMYYRCLITNTDTSAIRTQSVGISKTVTIKVR